MVNDGHSLKSKRRITSPLKWHGGKYYMVPTLRKIQARLMKPILTRAEHFAGSLAWTLDQDPEGVSEIANDLNGKLTNFWRVLQYNVTFHEFQRIIQSVPFSEDEWK